MLIKFGVLLFSKLLWSDCWKNLLLVLDCFQSSLSFQCPYWMSEDVKNQNQIHMAWALNITYYYFRNLHEWMLTGNYLGDGIWEGHKNPIPGADSPPSVTPSSETFSSEVSYYSSPATSALVTMRFTISNILEHLFIWLVDGSLGFSPHHTAKNWLQSPLFGALLFSLGNSSGFHYHPKTDDAKYTSQVLTCFYELDISHHFFFYFLFFILFLFF